jgi:hypothetical protein
MKNRFLTGLSSFLNMLDDQLEDPEAERRFLFETLPQWPARAREAKELIREFGREMSPKVLFSCPPLNQCNSETMGWLSGVVDAIWRQRVQADQLSVAAEESLAGANDAFAAVAKAVRVSSQPACVTSLQLHRESFVRFRTACERLSRSFSQFPNRIEVI